MTERVSNTSKRLRELMHERGLRQVDIINRCKPYCDEYHILINKAHMSLYVNGTVEPSQGKLFILGLALGVSEAWLMGYDVPMEREPKRAQDYFVNAVDRDLFVEIESLSGDQKELLRKYIELLKITKR